MFLKVDNKIKKVGEFLTAEIGILNKHGVVLAADSAVTIGGGKVYNSARKLFTLNPNHSIGIMVYGNAEYMNIPWEILIKKFSAELKNDVLDSTENYVQYFIDFLKREASLDNENASQNYVFQFSRVLISFVTESASQPLNEMIENGIPINNQNLIDNILNVIETLKANMTMLKPLTELNEDEFFKEFESGIFESLYLSINVAEVIERVKEPFKWLVLNLIQRKNDILSNSGIVIAGYGKNDMFPSIFSYDFQAKVLGNLVYSREHAQKVVGTLPYISDDDSDDNIEYMTSSIVPFAQRDVVETVLMGIAPEIQDKLFELLSDPDTIEEEKANEVVRNLRNFQQEHFISKMVNSVEILQIDELSDVAETLINLTGFKRKYTSDLPTVGGPIDVLAISLGEGPVWIKRKHFFDIEKNLGFKIRKGGLSE